MRIFGITASNSRNALQSGGFEVKRMIGKKDFVARKCLPTTAKMSVCPTTRWSWMPVRGKSPLRMQWILRMWIPWKIGCARCKLSSHGPIHKEPPDSGGSLHIPFSPIRCLIPRHQFHPGALPARQFSLSNHSSHARFSAWPQYFLKANQA